MKPNDSVPWRYCYPCQGMVRVVRVDYAPQMRSTRFLLACGHVQQAA